jgi:hypothetical protein
LPDALRTDVPKSDERLQPGDCVLPGRTSSSTTAGSLLLQATQITVFVAAVVLLAFGFVGISGLVARMRTISQRRLKIEVRIINIPRIGEKLSCCAGWVRFFGGDMRQESSKRDFVVATAAAVILSAALSVAAVLGINHYLGPVEDPEVPHTSSIFPSSGVD